MYTRVVPPLAISETEAASAAASTSKNKKHLLKNVNPRKENEGKRRFGAAGIAANCGLPSGSPL